MVVQSSNPEAGWPDMVVISGWNEASPRFGLRTPIVEPTPEIHQKCYAQPVRCRRALSVASHNDGFSWAKLPERLPLRNPNDCKEL
jgi:hypothetical protein